MQPHYTSLYPGVLPIFYIIKPLNKVYKLSLENVIKLILEVVIIIIYMVNSYIAFLMQITHYYSVLISDHHNDHTCSINYLSTVVRFLCFKLSVACVLQ